MVSIFSSIFGNDDKDKPETRTPRSEKRSAAETAALGLAGALTAAGALGAASGSAKKNSQEEETVTVSLDCRHARVLMSRGGDGQAKGNPTASSI